MNVDLCVCAELPAFASDVAFQALFRKLDNGGIVFWPQFWDELKEFYTPPPTSSVAPAAIASTPAALPAAAAPAPAVVRDSPCCNARRAETACFWLL